jgi:hypothetical protein
MISAMRHRACGTKDDHSLTAKPDVSVTASRPSFRRILHVNDNGVPETAPDTPLFFAEEGSN